jgi:hypothetical protein
MRTNDVCANKSKYCLEIFVVLSKKRYLHVLLMFNDDDSRIYLRGRGVGDPAGTVRGRGWYEDVPREHWRGRGRGRGILLPAGAGMESYSPTGNSPLPSLDMGTPGSPPTKLTTVPDKWVRLTRRPADLSVGPTDLVGGSYDLLKTFQKIPRRPSSARPQDLAYQTRPRWISPKADRRDMARCVT